VSSVPVEGLLRASEQEGSVRVSVVIPAFNEEVHIARCLEALERQTVSKNSFEIVVVDNGSTDSTVAVARGFEEVLRLRVVAKTRCSISAVRNYGASLAAGTVLAFLDADCVARPGWLENALAVARDGRIWGAPYLVPVDATWVGRVWFKYQARQLDGEISFLPGGDLFICKSEFARVGGFNERVTTSEDVDICTRARGQGLEVVAYSSLGVFHEGTPRTLRGFYRQNRWHGEHVMRMFVDKLPSLKLLPIVGLSGYTLVMFWVALVGPCVAVFFHQWVILGLPVVLLVLPAAALSLAKTARRGGWVDGAPLFVLYLTYFLSRAAALTRVSTRRHR
jgi:glycosyltransferase involved in cell wall biosynthesis